MAWRLGKAGCGGEEAVEGTEGSQPAVDGSGRVAEAATVGDGGGFGSAAAYGTGGCGIEQSKGLKDRVVCLSAETVEALGTYLAVRGPAVADYVFLHRHWPLSPTYCGRRLRTLGAGCDMRVTPHQLRASFATLLLNAGASVLTVQALLGHKRVASTLRYARAHDSTVAADCVQAFQKLANDLTNRELATPKAATRK